VAGEPSSYDLLIDEQTGHHVCDCLGQTRWGHRHPCRHIAALLALIATGRIEVNRPVPAPVPTPKQSVPIPDVQPDDEELMYLGAEPPAPSYLNGF
jgi:hypothetical protein